MTPESVLQSAQADQITKANAWEVFHGATNQQDFESRLSSLNLPQDIKAHLWEIKYGAQGDPLKTGVGMEARAQQQAVTERKQQALGTPPDYAHKWIDLGHPGSVQPSAVPQLVRGATGALPGLGMMGGGLLASPGGPSAVAGVGLGGAAGEQARLLANRGIFGSDEPSTTSRAGLKSTAETALTGALTEGAMQGMGAATRGFMGRPRPIEAMKGGPVEAGTEDIFMATQPGAGAKDLALRDNIETAKGDLAEIQRQNPNALSEKAGGVVNPDMRVRQFVKNTNDYLGDLWKNQVIPLTRRWSQAQVSLQPMKQSMLDAVSGIQTEFSPGAARQVQAWVNRMPETESLGELMNRRVQVNSMLKSFEGKSVQDQAAILRQKPMVDALKAQDKAIDSAVMQELQNRGEPGIQELSKRYAALSDIRDSMQNQMNSAESYRMYRQIGVYMNPRSWFSAHERIPMGATRPGPLLEKGLERLERGGVTAPEPATPAPARNVPLLPAAGQSGAPQRISGTTIIDPSTQGIGAANTAKTFTRSRSVSGGAIPLGGISSEATERDVALQLKRGDISQDDVMQMAKEGKIDYDAPRRIFRAALRGVKAPPPETAAQYKNRKSRVIDKKDPDYLALPPEERKKLDIHTGFPLYNASNLEKINDIRRAKSRPDINIWVAPTMTKSEVMFTTWAQNGEKPATCYACPFYNSDRSCQLIGPQIQIKKFTMGVQEFWPCCGMQLNGEPNKGAARFISHCDPDTLGLVWINCRPGLEYGGATCGGKNGSDDCDYYYPFDTADKRESLTGHCQVMQNEVGCGDICSAWGDDDQVEWREAQEWLKKGIPPPPREEKA